MQNDEDRGVKTDGGAYVDGDVHVYGGDFVGRDQGPGGGSPPLDLDSAEAQAARERYLEALRKRYNVAHTAGFLEAIAKNEQIGSPKRLALLGEHGVYVPLTLDAPTAVRERRMQRPSSGPEDIEELERELRPLSLDEALELPKNLAIIGKAGSGKTTLLKVVASVLASEDPRQLAPDLSNAIPMPPPLPIFLPLRLFEYACRPEDADYQRCLSDLLRFVDDWFVQRLALDGIPDRFLSEHIRQGGKRRGANMGMMSVEHPDILKFLHAKTRPDAFINFNVSVKVTDRWMQNVLKADSSLHIVTNCRTGRRYLLPKKIDVSSYALSDLKEITGKKTPRVNKKNFYTVGDIWKIIIKCAHQAGEPGLAFIDRINRDNPTPSLGHIEATNPCGEQPLLPYEACNLGSINLTRFVNQQNSRPAIDYSRLAKTIRLAVRFLDNIIDVCRYPVRQTVRLAQANRKIGLGVMGLADSLFLLGIPYDCEKAVEFAEKIMSFVNKEAHQASRSLADERGPFPNWYESTWRTQKKMKLRNASVTCIAPTGTISMIADCSAGIEPLYSPVFLRRILNGSELVQINPIFRQIAEQAGFYSKKLERKIAKTGSIRKIPEIPAKIRKIFKFAYDINPEWHIRMQAAFQKHCDAAVSKTVNFGEKATISAVDKVYKLAYRLDCKGVTIYRRCTRECEPMSLY